MLYYRGRNKDLKPNRLFKANPQRGSGFGIFTLYKTTNSFILTHFCDRMEVPGKCLKVYTYADIATRRFFVFPPHKTNILIFSDKVKRNTTINTNEIFKESMSK